MSDQVLHADIVVIGGGPVGENVAQYAIEESGLTAIIIEGELLGGECSYFACMPSKALLRPLDVRQSAAHLGGITTPDIDATGVKEVPQRLIVIGGGVIACEAATWMAALGSRVTMLVRGHQLLDHNEPFAGELVGDALRAAGVDIVVGVDVTACTRNDARDTGIGRVHGGAVTVTASTGTYEADEILVATGRRPRLGDVGLEGIGVTPDDVRSGTLPTWLHVVGDASGEAPLTHWGKYRARVLGEQLAAEATGEQPASAPASVPVPQVVFTDPQVASVGMTEAEAREAGHDIAVARVPFSSAAGAALLRDDATGSAQLVVDKTTGRVLGATFVGPETAELGHGATIAIVGAVPVHALRHAVASYPTSSELWLRLLESLPRELRRSS